jgi:hypothetical protein
VTATCSYCTGQIYADLCPGGDTADTIEWRSGCGTATTTPGAGYPYLAEFGSADGTSADFECQWIQACNVSAPDVSLTYDEDTDTTTQCFAADGGSSTLCDPAALAPAKQSRTGLFTRHWNSGMRYYYNDLFYRSITRDEVRNQAKADCDAQTMSPANSQTLCNDALRQLPSPLSLRLMYCCSSSDSDDGV